MEVIEFLNQHVEIIRKPGRRRLTLCMRPDKFLSVRTNRGTTQKQIIDFLLLKQRWIERNILSFKAIQAVGKVPVIEDGGLFPFLGEQKYFRFSESKLKKPFFRIEDGFLICYRRDTIGSSAENVSEIQSALRNFYRTEAQRYLKQRFDYWVSFTSFEPRSLHFRTNKSRWGCCTSGGTITLNWKLVCQSPVLIDYVIVHELCHLKFLNHSKDFWNLVSLYFPDYKVLKKVLNQQQHLGHFLG